jgi:signal transduction histidine kinase
MAGIRGWPGCSAVVRSVGRRPGTAAAVRLLGAGRGALQRKYAATFAFLIGGAVLTSGLVETWFSYHEHRAALVRTQREQAAGAASRIAQFVAETQRAVAAVHTPGLPGVQVLAQRRGDYGKVLRQIPAITEISYVDAAGQERLRLSRLSLDVVDGRADRSEDVAVRQARADGVYFGPVYFRYESEPYMAVAVGEVGPDAGVSVAQVNLKLIWDVVSRIQIGQAGYAYVVDARGQLVAHPDISLVLQRTDLSALPQVRAAVAGSSGAAGRSDEAATGPNLRGQGVLSSHEAVEPPGWTVFVEQPLDEVFAPLEASLSRTALLLVVGLGLSVVASVVLAGRMVAPILALRAGAARLGAGALDQRISVRSGDELEALADEFNRMAERLRESYAELEQKVEARTAALAHALREIEDKSRQLEVASQHKSAFLANMSHELRTPLNAVLGYTELVRDGIYGEVPERVRAVLERVDLSGRHLLSLINDVLDLSKIEAGQLTLSLDVYSLREVIQAVGAAVEPLAGAKGLRLIVEVPTDLPAARGDQRRITQVLLNLAANAVKFTEAGEVRLRAGLTEAGFVVSVADTGPGIAEADQERIFEEFQQADGAGAAGRGGTGLGLAIARRIVELHGGRIGLESTPGRGSTFTVTLPVRVAAEAAVA